MYIYRLDPMGYVNLQIHSNCSSDMPGCPVSIYTFFFVFGVYQCEQVKTRTRNATNGKQKHDKFNSKSFNSSMVVFGSPKRWDRWHIIPQLAVYTTYIPLIYCLLGGYILPTTFYGNQKQPLNSWRFIIPQLDVLYFSWGNPSKVSA